MHSASGRITAHENCRAGNYLGVAAGAAALPAPPRCGRAALYPDRPVRLVLPFPPGGVFDIVGRPWADKVKTSLGTVFVDNQPGAGGSLAAQLVAHAPPDGYTIFLGGSSIHLAEMILREHPLLDPMKDLVPISMVAITGFGIAVHPSVPAHNLRELIDYVKANPGKLSYGSPGAGTMNHLSGEMLKSLTGITDLPHVPYRGAGPGYCRRHRRPDSDHHSGDDQPGARISSHRQIALAGDHQSEPYCRSRRTYRPRRSRRSGLGHAAGARLFRAGRNAEAEHRTRSTKQIVAPWRTCPIGNLWSTPRSSR